MIPIRHALRGFLCQISTSKLVVAGSTWGFACQAAVYAPLRSQLE